MCPYSLFPAGGKKECFDLDRLQAFETMLEAVQQGYEEAAQKMQALKAQGKEKTVTYKQHMANKLLYYEHAVALPPVWTFGAALPAKINPAGPHPSDCGPAGL